MSKTCEIIPAEESFVGTWVDTHHVFSVLAYGDDWSGRYIRETNYSPGWDKCHYSGSPIQEFNSVTQPNPFGLDSTNMYIDSIGWGATAVAHYRSHGNAPCDTTIYQQMQVECGPHAIATYTGYQNNVLNAEIGITTINSIRDGVSAGPITY